MKFSTTKNFDKHLRNHLRSGNLSKQKFIQRLDLFIQDRANPILKDHALSGNLIGKRAFSIKGDLRIIYREVVVNNEVVAVFLGLGTHAQIYGM